MSLTEDEIRSQPELWARAGRHAADLATLFGAPGERALVVGCGTSAFVAMSLAVLREEAGLGETDWAYASEPPRRRRYDRLVALTRSGTTTEILRLLEPGGGPAAGRRAVVTGTPDSPAAALADDLLVLAGADERSVVQTRFPTTTLVVGRAAFGHRVEHLAEQCRRALAAPLPVDVDAVRHHVYLGTGWTFGLAQEAALKVREAAQAWAEAYPVLDYRHGPIAVAGPGSLVWMLGPADDTLVRDVEATGATVLHEALFPEPYDPLVQLVLAQRLALDAAVRRGLDPDRPRHLTRSVVLPAGPGTPSDPPHAVPSPAPAPSNGATS